MDRPDRILIIRPSALGDVCRSVPLAASLKAHWPETEIDWLVNEPFVDAVRAHPALAQAIPFRRGALSGSLRRLNPGPTLDLIRRLRERRYGMVIDAQGLARSALLALGSGAPVRVGHREAREGGWAVLTHRVRQPATMHTVDRMLGLLSAIDVPVIPDMRLHAPPECRDEIREHAELAGGAIVLAPTSIWPGKQWPIERFLDLATRLHGSGHGPIAVVGGPNEREQCSVLLDQSDVPLIDCVGSTSVGTLMAIIERSPIVVANDSAALHIAVGFGRPAVALFGPTRTSLVGPYRRDADVIQHLNPGETASHKDAEAGRALMERISVDEVERAATDRLSRSEPRSP